MATADDKKTEAAASTTQAPVGQNIGVRLAPTGASDIPALSNFVRVQIGAPSVIVDFGFLEPAGLTALADRARKGGKMPEAIGGRLISRFALSPDALIALHQQLGQAINALRSQRGKKEG